jgi:hypothetical protein
LRPPPHQREVDALEPATADECGEPPIRVLRACDDHQPRRVAIQSMDDPGTLRIASRELAGERLHKRAAGPPRTRMDDEPSGLVDDEKVLVAPDDTRRRRRRGSFYRRRIGYVDLLAAGEPKALGARHPVNQRSRFDSPFRGCTRTEAVG